MNKRGRTIARGFVFLRCRDLGIAVSLAVLFGVALAAQTPEQAPAPPSTKQSESQPDPAASATGDGAAVQIDHRPLIFIKLPLGGYSAQQRAASVRDKLTIFARNRTLPVSRITVEDHQYWSQIKGGDENLLYVSEGDAQREGVARQLLAEQDAEIFRHAVTRYRDEHTWPHFFHGLLDAVLTTAGMILLVLGLARGYRWVRGRLGRWLDEAQAKLVTRKQFRVPAAYLAPPLLILIGIVRWGIIFFLLDAYLTLMLGYFAGTREVSGTLSNWFLGRLSAISQQIVSYLPNLVVAAVIGILTYYLIKLNGFFFSEIAAGGLRIRGFYADWANPSAKLVRALILVLAAIIIFPYLPGSKSPAFQGISIFVGVLLSLGSSSAVANAVAGTILTYMRSFQIGDYVEVGTTKGEVVEKTLLVTRICTPKREIVTIPNGAVMNAAVTNYSVQAAQGGVILYTTVSIGYNAPWRRVHELLVEAALATRDILKEPKPFVLETALSDFYVEYQINAYTDQPRYMQRIYSELHQNIQDRFNEAGVEIMSPHYSQLRDGNQTTIPADYLPSDYEPEAFRVRNAGDGVSEKKRRAG